MSLSCKCSHFVSNNWRRSLTVGNINADKRQRKLQLICSSVHYSTLVMYNKYEGKTFVRIVRIACRYDRTQLQLVQKKSILSGLVSILLYHRTSRKYVFVSMGIVLRRVLLMRCTGVLLCVFPFL
jgi:hypothetical protein